MKLIMMQVDEAKTAVDQDEQIRRHCSIMSQLLDIDRLADSDTGCDAPLCPPSQSPRP